METGNEKDPLDELINRLWSETRFAEYFPMPETVKDKLLDSDVGLVACLSESDHTNNRKVRKALEFFHGEDEPLEVSDTDVEVVMRALDSIRENKSVPVIRLHLNCPSEAKSENEDKPVRHQTSKREREELEEENVSSSSNEEDAFVRPQINKTDVADIDDAPVRPKMAKTESSSDKGGDKPVRKNDEESKAQTLKGKVFDIMTDKEELNTGTMLVDALAKACPFGAPQPHAVVPTLTGFIEEKNFCAVISFCSAFIPVITEARKKSLEARKEIDAAKAEQESRVKNCVALISLRHKEFARINVAGKNLDNDSVLKGTTRAVISYQYSSIMNMSKKEEEALFLAVSERLALETYSTRIFSECGADTSSQRQLAATLIKNSTIFDRTKNNVDLIVSEVAKLVEKAEKDAKKAENDAQKSEEKHKIVERASDAFEDAAKKVELDIFDKDNKMAAEIMLAKVLKNHPKEATTKAVWAEVKRRLRVIETNAINNATDMYLKETDGVDDNAQVKKWLKNTDIAYSEEGVTDRKILNELRRRQGKAVKRQKK